MCPRTLLPERGIIYTYNILFVCLLLLFVLILIGVRTERCALLEEFGVLNQYDIINILPISRIRVRVFVKFPSRHCVVHNFSHCSHLGKIP